MTTKWEYDAVIPNGAAASSSIQLNGATLVGVFVPATWTTANLGVEVSRDGSTWAPAYDAAGELITFVVAAGGTYIALPAGAFNGIEYVRFTSHNAGTPVNQGGNRTIVAVLRPFE